MFRRFNGTSNYIECSPLTGDTEGVGSNYSSGWCIAAMIRPQSGGGSDQTIASILGTVNTEPSFLLSGLTIGLSSGYLRLTTNWLGGKDVHLFEDLLPGEEPLEEGKWYFIAVSANDVGEGYVEVQAFAWDLEGEGWQSTPEEIPSPEFNVYEIDSNHIWLGAKSEVALKTEPSEFFSGDIGWVLAYDSSYMGEEGIRQWEWEEIWSEAQASGYWASGVEYFLGNPYNYWVLNQAKTEDGVEDQADEEWYEDTTGVSSGEADETDRSGTKAMGGYPFYPWESGEEEGVDEGKTVDGKATGSGKGSGTAKGKRSRRGKAAGTGTGSGVAKGEVVKPPTVPAARVVSEPVDDTVFVELIDVNGKPSRRAGDEPDPADIPIGLKSATTAPGGHQDASFTMLRDPRRTWSDLNLVDEVIVRGRTRPLGRNIFEGQIASLPSVLGESTSISVNAVGNQVLLSDNEAFRAIYVQLGPEGWDPPSLARRETIVAWGWPQGRISAEVAGGALVWTVPNETLAAGEGADLIAAAPAGLKIAKVGYRGIRKGDWSKFEAPTLWADSNEAFTAETISAGLTLDNTVRVVTLSSPQRYLLLRAWLGSALSVPAGVQQSYDLIARYGDHGLPLRDIPGALPGLYPHDVLEHMLATGAPDLQFKVGAGGTITPNTTFAMPDLAFPEPTTVKEALEKLNAYYLNNWAVWDDKKFYWQPWDPDRLTWKASVAGGAHWAPTGRQAETLINGLVVDFTDAAGVSRTAGPPGSGCDYEHTSLQDPDPNNPYTRRGRRRWGRLSIGFPVAYFSAALQIGAVFLAESKMPQRAGALTIRPKPGGHVPSIRHPTMGELPIWAMRAGDYCELDGWPEPEPFRVISTDYDHDAKTLTAQLDTGAARLSAIFERVGVRLTGIA